MFFLSFDMTDSIISSLKVIEKTFFLRLLIHGEKFNCVKYTPKRKFL